MTSVCYHCYQDYYNHSHHLVFIAWFTRNNQLMDFASGTTIIRSFRLSMNLVIPLLTKQFQLTTYVRLTHNAAAVVFFIQKCKIIFLKFQYSLSLHITTDYCYGKLKFK